MDRDEIKGLLEELNNKLAKENKKASILIAGGAAISFLFEDYKREINEMEKINNQTQNQISKDAENTKTEKLYITLHKTYCRQLEDKIHEGKTFNMISIPKGTMLNGKDIGGFVFNPKLMFKNKYNSNELVAQYSI